MSEKERGREWEKKETTNNRDRDSDRQVVIGVIKRLMTFYCNLAKWDLHVSASVIIATGDFC